MDPPTGNREEPEAAEDLAPPPAKKARTANPTSLKKSRAAYHVLLQKKLALEERHAKEQWEISEKQRRQTEAIEAEWESTRAEREQREQSLVQSLRDIDSQVADWHFKLIHFRKNQQ